MKLYMSPFSHNCRKVRAVLYHLALSCEEQEVDMMAGDNKQPDYLRINPNGMVPALKDGSLVLWESNAIIAYLCEKSGDTTIWPSDVVGRAHVNKWLSWNNAHWQPPIDAIVIERVLKKVANQGPPDDAVIARSLESFHRFAAVLNNHLEGRNFLSGDKLCVADYVVAASFTYAGAAEIPLGDYRRIAAYSARMDAQHAWKKSAPPPLG